MKFVELAKGYKERAHIYRIETVKEMDRWIKENRGKRRGQEESTEQARENSVYIAFTDQVITRNASWSLSLSLLPVSLSSPCVLQHQSLTTAIRNSTVDHHANSSRAMKRNSGRCNNRDARRTHLSRVSKGECFSATRTKHEPLLRSRSSFIRWISAT